MSDNVLLNLIEKTVKKFSSYEEAYEIQKLVEKEQNPENVFGFWSPFDGVGRTTVVVNVAYELSKRGHKVCVVDLNMLLPDAFRYLKPDFEINKKEEVKSLREKLINSTLPISEFITKTKFPNVALLTPLFTEHPSVYCPSETSVIQESRMMDVYISIFKELANLYDYVLLDLCPNIIDISTIAAFRSCDNIITFVGHYPKSIEYVMKTIKIFGELGLFGIFDNLIQGPIYTETWLESELRNFNPNFNIIANIPHSNEVNVAGNNLEIFMAYNKSSNRAAIKYRESINRIVVTIQELAKQTREKNEKQKQEVAKNAQMIMRGLQNYITEEDVDIIELDKDAFITGIIDSYQENEEENAIIELSGELILDENIEIITDVELENKNEAEESGRTENAVNADVNSNSESGKENVGELIAEIIPEEE